MSSNNLYGQLIQMAKQEDITLSQISSGRQSQHKTLDQFSLKMAQVKEKINIIKQTNLQIISFKDKLASNAIPARQYQLQQHVKALCDQNYEQIVVLKNELQSIGRIVKDAVAQSPDQPQTFSKMYYRQYLTIQVQKIIRQTNKIQKIIEKYSINTSLNRIRALAPDLDEDEAMEIAKKKDGFDQIVMSKTIGKASLKLKYRLNDILEKHQGILKLQKSVQQNLRLMNQIAFLVKQQGQMIDNIYQHVIVAKDYIEKAQANLAKQKKQHKMTRKKKCCIILVGIIILALVLTPIIIKIVKSKQAA